jgi:hypothetical protein
MTFLRPIRTLISTVERYALRDSDLELACREAEREGLDAVLASSRDVAEVRRALAQGVSVVAAIAYPSGALPLASKVFEMQRAIADGADALCLVLDTGAIRDGLLDVTVAELDALAHSADGRPAFVCTELSLLSEWDLDRLADKLHGRDVVVLPTTMFAGYEIECDVDHEAARIVRRELRGVLPRKRADDGTVISMGWNVLLGPAAASDHRQ